MNHDACHCSDYNKIVCPQKCYRAKLTEDLKDREDEFAEVPLSFARFKGTPACEANLKGEKQ